MNSLLPNEVFGLLKTAVDVHTLGISLFANVLRNSGYKTFISDDSISKAIIDISKINNWGLLQRWIINNNITRLGFSYRLDPVEGKDYFCKLYYMLKDYNLLSELGGPLRGVFFAGLPDACRLVQNELGRDILVYPGDETPSESLSMLGVPEERWAKDLIGRDEYDDLRWSFALKLIESESYKNIPPPDHSSYAEFGTEQDSVQKRLNAAKKNNTLPLIRAHVGPYNTKREEAIKEFIDWCKVLSKASYLDVLSIGTSQLTQSNFGEDWTDMPNGGGVPVNSVVEYREIKESARPMLVRTYSGTKNVPGLALLHEKSLNICWHALSFWWFCELDGRGDNSLLENLKEHFETIRYIASTNKPLEANVSHHFAFRGADDVTYIISAYLAAKAAKINGIKVFILQNMLNTPKYTSGVQDLAKGRAMLYILRTLEDANFKVYLQNRAGLDYFSPDLDKAKVQLAAVTALMDDIEPLDHNSPNIIHVVSYSEAISLATPPIINESIQITLAALRKYRTLRSLGQIENMKYNKEVDIRTVELCNEALRSIELLESSISELYTPEGFYKIFEEGFLPVPYLLDTYNKYPKAKQFFTQIKDGGVKVVDDKGEIIYTPTRYKKLLDIK